MTQIIEKDGFKWIVRDNEKTDLEPLRDYEATVIEACIGLANSKYTFVDVGANVGRYSVIMSKHYGEVYAIEPNPYNLEALRENLRLNGCSNVKVVECAVGDKNTEAYLTLQGANSEITNNGFGNVIRVDIKRLDNLIKHADVVKIDVEGFELRVVLGSKKLIQRCKPIFVIEHNEYWRDDIPTTHRDIARYLAGFGYYPFNLNFMHWVYIPDEKRKLIPEKVMAMLLSHHVFYEVIYRNIRAGREWYHGIPYNWWHGMSILEFIRFLPDHVLKEPEWLMLYDKTLRYLI